MTISLRSKVGYYYVLLLLLVLLARFFSIKMLNWDLIPGELKYLNFSNDMTSSIISWVIDTTTTFFGDSEFAIRLSSPIFHTLTSIVVYFIASKLYDKKIGFLCGMNYLLLPLVSISSLTISSQPLILFVSAIVLLLFLMVCKIDQENGDYRKFGIIASLVLCALNIVLHYGGEARIHTKPVASDNIYIVRLLAEQFILFGPILFSSLIFVCLTFKKVMQNKNDMMLVIMVELLLTFFVLAGLVAKVSLDFLLPLYIPAVILTTKYLFDHKKILYSSFIIHILIFVTIVNFHHITKLAKLHLSGKDTEITKWQIKDPFVQFRSWNELSERVAVLQKNYKNSAIVTDSEELYEELSYYADTNDIIQYDLAELAPKFSEFASNTKYENYIYISHLDSSSFHLDNSFKVEFVEKMIVPLHKDSQIVYYIYHISKTRLT